ncbi:maltose O-acetyltransferase [Ligilactobacillus apodemi DSM 16634 = JCM 16172]|uniref:Acetyltransferase n=2 Tax=Ligilactobacillus TaxID=2767887 RepID=A0A0R1TWW4_9LACO|nr:maltose O-acetyltransferase [Ligilactobacillus apodemi DSM 16634 = JCM 16172]
MGKMEDFDYQQMLAGELYVTSEILPQNNARQGKMIAQQINQIPIEDKAKIQELVKKLFGKTGKDPYITPPVYVDYGRHVSVGDNFYANFDCIFLDVNRITIGDNVMFGPRVGLYTAGHPLDSKVRNEDQLEFGLPITIKDNVWLGGNVCVLPGVTIGENSVIGTGAVVTKDIPANSVAVGNPAKVVKTLGEKERKYWEKKRAEYFAAKQKFLADK